MQRSSATIVMARVATGQAVKWWFEELRGLLPAGWRGSEGSHIEAAVTGDGLALRICTAPHATSHGTLRGSTIEPADFARSLEQLSARLPLWFYPAKGTVLSRRIQVPRSARGQFGTLLKTEADRWTSFSFEEIHVAWRLLAGENKSRVDVDLYFLPRDAVDEAFAALRTHGLDPSRVVLDESQRIWADLQAARISARRRRRQVGWTMVLMAAVFFLAADWTTAVHRRDVLLQQIAAARRDLKRQQEVEAKISDVLAASSAANGQSGAARNAFFVALAAALPATDWLTEVTIRDSQATMRGYTAQPEVLIRSLEPLATDRGVILQGELTVDKKLDRNRFAVVLRLPR